jgi:hypothetical protein
LSTTRTRLTPIGENIRPFRRAREEAGCELYWIGVPAFPMPAEHAAWLRDFLVRLTAAVEKQFELRGEFFFEYKSVGPIEKRFRRLALEVHPWPGLFRKPGSTVVFPDAPPKEKLQAAVQGEPFDITQYFPDSCFWLRAPLAKLLPEFFGFGGASMFYLPPDPGAKPPEIPFREELKILFPSLSLDKLEEITKVTCSLREKFLQQSKELFGVGLEDEPAYPGISFILPLLETHDFFTAPPQEKEKWFQLFGLFWRESPPDKGLYMASKLPLEEHIAAILESMKEEGKIYPLR